MSAITLTLRWPPTINHYYVRSKRGMFIGPEGQAYRVHVIEKLREAGARALEGPLRMSINAFPPDKRRRDLDNILKALWDALQRGGAFNDDSQIKSLRANMLEVEKPDGKVVVTIQEIDG
jgi:crossover junction endodeoxyribonuclease RusA